MNILSSSPRSRRNRWQGKAVVQQAIKPRSKGRVFFKGSCWYARCDQDITLVPNQTVEVIGRDNITLIVQPTS